MGWVIFFGLVGLLAVGCIIAAASAGESYEEDDDDGTPNNIWIY